MTHISLELIIISAHIRYADFESEIRFLPTHQVFECQELCHPSCQEKDRFRAK